MLPIANSIDRSLLTNQMDEITKNDCNLFGKAQYFRARIHASSNLVCAAYFSIVPTHRSFVCQQK